MVEPEGDPDEVSFGRWKVTSAEVGAPAPKGAIVEVRVSRTEFLLGDAQHQSLGSWSVDQASLDV